MTEPRRRYWYHSESDALWFTDDGEDVRGDDAIGDNELVEELDADAYAAIHAKLVAYSVPRG